MLVLVGENGGGFDVIEIWKILFQVGIAFHLDLALVGAAAPRGAVAVFAVDLDHDRHAFDHFAVRDNCTHPNCFKINPARTK